MAASRRRLTYTKIRNNLLIQEKNLNGNKQCFKRIFERDVKIDNAGINNNRIERIIEQREYREDGE